jgi:hypothetical protein
MSLFSEVKTRYFQCIQNYQRMCRWKGKKRFAANIDEGEFEQKVISKNQKTLQTLC